jgi:tetratricopeptide (TPR) repeat protein
MKLNTARGPLIFTEESTSESEDRVDVPLKISKSKPKLKKSMTSLFDVKVEARLPSNNDLGLLIKGAQFKEESGHFCEAFEEYNKALVFMKTAKVKDKLAVIEINIGISRIFIHEELYADALTTLNKAYSIASKMPSALNKLVECYTMFAETSLGLIILYKAWQEITYALKLSEKLSKGENKMIVSDLHKVLGKIYIAKGQANEALSCFRKAIALKGTICSSLRANAEMNHLMALAYIQLTSFLEAENLLN